MFKHLILTLLAIATVTVATLAPAHAETTWTTWGEAPYATSQEEAIRRLPDALRDLNIPEPVRALLQAEVQRNPQGTRVYLTPGKRFLGMMTGGVRPHAMHDVVVGRNPVRRGAVQAAEAREWRVDYEGQTYILTLPDICYNWAWNQEPLPQEVALEECAIVEVAVQQGDFLQLAVFSGASLPSSHCWGYQQSGEWEMWGECVECPPWASIIGNVPAADRRVRMPGVIRVTRTGFVQVRVPVAVERHHLAFYLERNGLCSWVIVEPSDWRSHSFRLTEAHWTWRPQGS